MKLFEKLDLCHISNIVGRVAMATISSNTRESKVSIVECESVYFSSSP